MSPSAPSNRKARRAAQKRGKGAGPAQEDVNTLVGLYRAGRLDEAIEGARRFTQRWPKSPIGWNVLATALHERGHPMKAREPARRAARLEPDSADTQALLGAILEACGMLEDSASAYRRAVKLAPSVATHRYHLGNVLRMRGDNEEAVEQYREALRRQPGLLAARNNLGNALRTLGRHDEAEQCFREALERNPALPLIHNNLGSMLLDRERPEEAEGFLRKAIEQQPEHADALANLGLALVMQGRLEEAARALRSALTLQPSARGVEHNLANALRELGQVEEAEARYRALIEAEPANASLWNDLGVVLAERGHLDDAREALHRAVSIDPRHAAAWWHLAWLGGVNANDSAFRDLEALAASEEHSGLERGHMEYAVGRVRLDAGCAPEQVFASFLRGAASIREVLEYDVDEDVARFEAIARTFSPQACEAAKHAGETSGTPIFIVGMPRSGTTLLEQMLASHPGVHAGGERPDLPMQVRRLERAHGREFPDCALDLTPDDCASLAHAYAQGAIPEDVAAAHFTDKLPANFRYLGLIHRAMPHARVIHVRRDPVDTCLSCFLHLFRARQAFSYDLRELGLYYRAYARLMDHWRFALPQGWMLELDYESLTSHPEHELRNAVTHCGLDWDPSCLDFHDRTPSVRTASAGQVREPLHRRSIGRWRAFREQLAPLLEALGPLAPAEVQR